MRILALESGTVFLPRIWAQFCAHKLVIPMRCLNSAPFLRPENGFVFMPGKRRLNSLFRATSVDFSGNEIAARRVIISNERTQDSNLEAEETREGDEPANAVERITAVPAAVPRVALVMQYK